MLLSVLVAVLADTPITVVHVINSCHLDIGFADSAAGIINRYFDHHLPEAASVGAALAAGVEGYTDHKLNFMFQSWVLDLFFDCPPNLGVNCPSATAQAAVKDAIDHGHITWHAFPFNAQFEVMGVEMIEAGLELTRALDRRFGVGNKTTLSQRDVPGMTRAMIPILEANGVTAISIGANDGSSPPQLPPCFVWKDPASGKSLLGLFNWPGYGSLPISHQKQRQVPGLEHALVYNWNGDNAGPSDAKRYAANWQEIAKVFPGAEVVASTLDNFTQHLAAVASKLPVVELEVGDSWVYGVPSDPQKVSMRTALHMLLDQACWTRHAGPGMLQARHTPSTFCVPYQVSRMRAMNRAWGAAADAAGGMVHALRSDAVLRNATRFALKLGEHTWGRDVKSTLFDNYSWRNADFEKAKAAGSKNASQYAALESSWWEQREWSITVAVDTLSAAAHPLARAVEQSFAMLEPSMPSLEGFVAAQAGERIRCGELQVAIDTTGAISHLTDDRDKHSWADAQHTLLATRYRTYSADDVQHFFGSYCMSDAGWVQHDYGKPGLPATVAGALWETHLASLHVMRGARGTCSIVIETAFDARASSEYGAPAQGWTALLLRPENRSIEVQVNMLKKTTTRLPEAMFVQFTPPARPTSAAAGAAEGSNAWAANKLGSWVGPNDIVDGGSKHLHGITEAGLRVTAADGHMMHIEAADAAVANFGELTAYPSPVNVTADTDRFGASFLLWDNLWGTNYVMWWPFVVPPPAQYAVSAKYFPARSNRNMMSRFTIRLG